jgi:hypothetical protein
MTDRISVVEALTVRRDRAQSLADDIAGIIHDRAQRGFASAQAPLALTECIDYDDHYGLAWAIVRHLLRRSELDAKPEDPDTWDPRVQGYW